MDTYLLTGNPNAKDGGMDRERYRKCLDECRTKGHSDTIWTIAYVSRDRVSLKQAKEKHENRDGQVVLLRQGNKELGGVIGFGTRLRGEIVETVRNSKDTNWIEAPVRYFNLRPLEERPFVSSAKLIERGWKKSRIDVQRSGTILSNEELETLENCCLEIFNVPLSTLCSTKTI